MDVDYQKNVKEFEKRMLEVKQHAYELNIKTYEGLMNKKAPKELLDKVAIILIICKLEMELALLK